MPATSALCWQVAGFKDPMFHINTSLGAISAAETIASSLRLLDEEKIILLEALRETITTDLACLPAHVKVADAAISRILLDYARHTPSAAGGNPKAQKQGRKAKGIEDAPSVAAEGTEEGPEAPSGTTEGIERPAEDPRGDDRAEPDTEASTREAEGPTA